jgi:outer membrane protein OmpA-like peptidoglycan-associated protein/tetratricopeptide (TPR) repeat protein
MKTIFLILLSSLSLPRTFAQWYDPEKVNLKARKVYEQAYENAMNSQYTESIRNLEEALKLEPRYVEAYLSRAGIYADLKDYPASVRDFEAAFRLDSVFTEPYHLQYSISLAGTGEFGKALAAINKFLSIRTLNEQSIKAGNYRKRTYEFAVDYARRHKTENYTFIPRNLGPGINTGALEYFPSLTIDGKTMIFNRRIDDDEDFYESTFENGQWSNAQPLGGKINTNLNEGAQNISQDGEWLIFTGCNYPEGIGSCDLYIAYKNKNGSWTEAENMGRPINTDQWESTPSLSPDKKDLYFTSNRTGGYGGKDIWVTHRRSNGKWSVPENMGPEINTSADETCPFIHADNQTLYFNSNGHMGYGKADIFLTRKINDSTWTQPENLGYPINTIDNEGSLIIASDGKTSYYDSDRGDSKAGLDIFTFDMREDVRPAKTLWVKGRVSDKKTMAGLPCTVELTDIDSRRIISTLQTDEDGNYLVTLPEGKTYALNVARKGYLFYSDNFSVPANSPDSFFIVNIPLQPIEAGASIVLKNIFFGNNKFELEPGSISELDKLVMLMKENPRLKAEISGHTDHVGKKQDNLALSLNRAKSVTAYLVSKGIDAARLAAKGFGDSKPIAPNSTEQGKSLNRRTELNVVSN